MQPERDEIDTVRATVDAERLLATAEALIDVPSPRRSAGPVAEPTGAATGRRRLSRGTPGRRLAGVAPPW
ncbi:MAG: hypothetical protein VCF24_08320 [Candidatus Latescibacterota bacterium]